MYDVFVREVLGTLVDLNNFVKHANNPYPSL
jgi:hypothetical protein